MSCLVFTLKSFFPVNVCVCVGGGGGNVVSHVGVQVLIPASHLNFFIFSDLLTFCR